ncbi:mechanosensitive ion channel family protein [Isachenkonia alkalipeptolytica]|uniref:Mechanosensitive ion channel n=1 Tax=Isachenkonia alkalipeptolytica TaxID=2565777 RepID=A0AA43XMI8_9CLOT|nr:mechanosensitive ion channel domain-containing protein [Isachenkonia alkalipeptolytica]NBG89302.1 mechanosensitive ion channel [Isachenkonia alkalipeptolytica]
MSLFMSSPIGDPIAIEDTLSFMWDFVVVLGSVTAIYLIKWLLIKLIGKIFYQKKEIIGIFNTLLNAVVFLAIIIIIPIYFGESAWLFSQVFEVGGSGISLFLILMALFIIIFAYRFSMVFKRYILRSIYEKYQLEKGTRFTLNSVVHYLIMFLAVFISLSTLGINLSTLTVFASIVGVGIGFGMQNIASNFISGLIILFERPIKVGDRVLIEEIIGDVVQIKMRATIVKTLDNEHIIIPNSFFLEEKVMNRSAEDLRLRLRVNFGVSYNSDVFHVRDVALKVAEDITREFSDILIDPEPAVGFLDYGDSSLDFVLLIWIENPKNEMKIKSAIRFMLFKAFQEEKIEIPFPQRDLHIRSIDAKAEEVIQELISKADVNGESKNTIK